VDQSEALLTLAELAVALAGFASLVSVIGRRPDEKSRGVDSFRLQIMLEMCFRNAALALLPLPFLAAEPSDPSWVWRASSGVFLVSTLVYAFFTARRTRRTQDAYEPALLFRMTAIAALSVLVNLANVLGLGGAHAFALYFGALALALGSAGLLFLAVAASVFRERGT
jgi:hypothetical protein